MIRGRPLSRPLFLLLGWACVGIGIVGIAVPGLPTVPFLLLAAWAFERGSGRMHRWLMEHPRLGPPVRDWRLHGVIPRRGKVAAMLALALTLTITVLAGLPLWLLAVQITILSAVATFILTRPSVPRA